jgi:hypothetical protein
MTIKERPPLWELMAETCAEHPDGIVDLKPGAIAAQIRALRDWLVPEPEEPLFTATDEAFAIWEERKALRAVLTAEADRAEDTQT